MANAAAADVAIVFAAHAARRRRRGISAFLVPAATRRASRGGPAPIRSASAASAAWTSTSPTSASTPISGSAQPGKGFSLARLALEGGRVAIAAQALGVGQAALDEALAYAKSRDTFGQPIANYQAIQCMLADMATELDAARMLTLGPRRRDHAGAVARSRHGQAVRLGSRASRRRQAMQILASAGYRRGSRVERLFRDVRGAELYQGTSEVQRMIIAAHVLES